MPDPRIEQLQRSLDEMKRTVSDLKSRMTAFDRARVEGSGRLVLTNGDFDVNAKSDLKTILNRIPTKLLKEALFELVGDIAVNGFKITSINNGDIVIRPNGTGNIYLGGENDYTKIEPDGTVVSIGNATVYDDINKSLLPLSTGVGVPDIIAVNGDTFLRVRAFDGNTLIERLGESLEILHGYEEGSNIIPHLHWAPTTNGSGDVKWQLRYMWLNRDETFTSAQTISVVVPAGGVAWKENRTSFPEINGAGKQIGSRFVFVLFRDPTDAQDTYAADAAAFDFGVHYRMDMNGSRGVVEK